MAVLQEMILQYISNHEEMQLQMFPARLKSNRALKD